MGGQSETPLPGLPTGNEWRNAVVERPGLAPCPFCNHPPSLITWVHPVWAAKFQLCCLNKSCECTVSTQQKKSLEEAERVWETRSAQVNNG